MVIKDVLEIGIKMLNEKNVESSTLEAKLILASTLFKTKEYITASLNKNIEQPEIDKFLHLIKRRSNYEPIQYILGKTEFMKLTFNVNESVLIPRPDTEILVQQAIKIYKWYYKEKQVNILDLCTGSGAIGVSLAKYIPLSTVYASDISKSALDLAIENAILNGVYKKIIFKYADLFNEYVNDDFNYIGERLINVKFDLICSNPPYIAQQELPLLQEEVKREPSIALNGGKDGLDYYLRIIKQAKGFLNKYGYLLLEIGYNQKKDVIKLLEKENVYKNVQCIQDLSGNDRVIICQYQGEK